jgi:hypothetical protein
MVELGRCFGVVSHRRADRGDEVLYAGGEARQSIRSGSSPALWNASGALTVGVMVSPVDAVMVCPRSDLDLAVQDAESRLEVVAVGRGPAAGGDVHVEQRESAVGFATGRRDR